MRKKLRDVEIRRLLRNAEVLATTLNSAGGGVVQMCAPKVKRNAEALKFDVLIIDEASQATEHSVLIPLNLLKAEVRYQCLRIMHYKPLVEATCMGTGHVTAHHQHYEPLSERTACGFPLPACFRLCCCRLHACLMYAYLSHAYCGLQSRATNASVLIHLNLLKADMKPTPPPPSKTSPGRVSVSYTHLTLPTICSV